MGSADAAVAIVLGLLLLAVVLGGVVWLDVGPVGRQGRALREKQPTSWPRTVRGWLTGRDPDD